MKRWLKGILIVSLGFILFACSDSNTQSQSESVRDSDIGLRKVDLQDEKDVKLLDYEYISSAAGESERIERSFENAPPMISHSVEGMLPITKDDNQCLACHDLQLQPMSVRLPFLAHTLMICVSTNHLAKLQMHDLIVCFVILHRLMHSHSLPILLRLTLEIKQAKANQIFLIFSMRA